MGILSVTVELNRQISHAQAISKFADMMGQTRERVHMVSKMLRENYGENWRNHLPWAMRRIRKEMSKMSNNPNVKEAWQSYWSSLLSN